jgi:hypothetical protein
MKVRRVPGTAHLHVSDESDNKLSNCRLPLRLAERTCFANQVELNQDRSARKAWHRRVTGREPDD